MSTMPTTSSPTLARRAESMARATLAVVPPHLRPRTRTPFVVLVLVLLGTGVAGLLLFNTRMQQASFELSRVEARAATLEAREQTLQLELDRLRDPQRVARAARSLGMVPPPAPAFIRLSDGRVLGDPRPASADDAMRINPPAAAKPRALAPEPRVVEVELTVREARALERLEQARREAREARQAARGEGSEP